MIKFAVEVDRENHLAVKLAKNFPVPSWREARKESKPEKPCPRCSFESRGRKMTVEDNLTGSNSCSLLLKSSLVVFLVAEKPRSLSVSGAGAKVCFPAFPK